MTKRLTLNLGLRYELYTQPVDDRDLGGFSRGFNLLANYTISKNLETNGSGDSSYSRNGSTSLPLDAFNRKRDNGPAPLDIPQRFVVSFGYELPFGPGKAFLPGGGVMGKLVGGWQVNGISVIRGGFPTDIRVSLVPQTFATFNVPDRVPGVAMYAHKGVDQQANCSARHFWILIVPTAPSKSPQNPLSVHIRRKAGEHLPL